MAGRKFRVDVSERDFFRILFGGVGEIVAAGAVEDFDEFFPGIKGFGVCRGRGRGRGRGAAGLRGQESGDGVGIGLGIRAVERAGHVGGGALGFGIKNPRGEPGVVATRADALEVGGVHRQLGRAGGGGRGGRVAFGAAVLEEKVASGANGGGLGERGVGGVVGEERGGDGFPEEAFFGPLHTHEGVAAVGAGEGGFERVGTFAEAHGLAGGGEFRAVGGGDLEDVGAVDFEFKGAAQDFGAELEITAEVGIERAGPGRGEFAGGQQGRDGLAGGDVEPEVRRDGGVGRRAAGVGEEEAGFGLGGGGLGERAAGAKRQQPDDQREQETACGRHKSHAGKIGKRATLKAFAAPRDWPRDRTARAPGLGSPRSRCSRSRRS